MRKGMRGNVPVLIDLTQDFHFGHPDVHDATPVHSACAEFFVAHRPVPWKPEAVSAWRGIAWNRVVPGPKWVQTRSCVTGKG